MRTVPGMPLMSVRKVKGISTSNLTRKPHQNLELSLRKETRHPTRNRICKPLESRAQVEKNRSTIQQVFCLASCSECHRRVKHDRCALRRVMRPASHYDSTIKKCMKGGWNPTSNPTSKPQGKPSMSRRKETWDPMSNLMSRSCLATPFGSTGNVGLVSSRFSLSSRYPSRLAWSSSRVSLSSRYPSRLAWSSSRVSGVYSRSAGFTEVER